MSNTDTKRIDEVSRYYDPVENLEKIGTILFWVNAALSLIMPYSDSIFGNPRADIIQGIFLVLVLIYFGFSQSSSLYFFPEAEIIRRKQLLSNSFGIPLTQEITALYYNNPFSPSVQRLGANTMENALFSQEIASRMLSRKRKIVFVYFLSWILAFSFRRENFEIVAWITQIVFSSEILSGWIKLEIFRSRCKHIYNQLHSHFLYKLGQDYPNANANVLNAFVDYEAAKSMAGILLSTNDFNIINPILSKTWEKTCIDLDMQNKIN
jgi:hypothetical protein